MDGRGFTLQGYENGFFLGGSLFDHVTPDMRIYKEEIFGPVLSVVRAPDYEEALRLPTSMSTATAWRSSPATATRRATSPRRVQVGMVGVNVPIPVPIAYHTFGGWKRSGFGDLNQHGPDSVRFYTKTKTVTSALAAAAAKAGPASSSPPWPERPHGRALPCRRRALRPDGTAARRSATWRAASRRAASRRTRSTGTATSTSPSTIRAAAALGMAGIYVREDAAAPA